MFGVDVLAVFDELKVEVRAGGAARGAHIADDFILFDRLSRSEAFFIAAKMGISGF